MVETQALATISELQLEDLEAALHLGSHGWKAEIKQFIKTNSQSSLIRAVTDRFADWREPA